MFGSSFSKGAWTQHVKNERLPPLVWGYRDVVPNAAYMVADVKRCRRRAFEFTAHKIPIFSPLHNVKTPPPIFNIPNRVT